MGIEMTKISLIAAIGALIILIAATVASAQGAMGSANRLPKEVVGRYSCLSSDRTEISMSNRSSGHKYHDLDGDTSDPSISVAMEIGVGQKLRLQSVFAGEAGALEDYTILKTVRVASGDAERSIYQIVAVSVDPSYWIPLKVVHVTVNGAHQTIGLMRSTLSSSKPAMRDGEKFATSDVELMLCTKSQ